MRRERRSRREEEVPTQLVGPELSAEDIPGDWLTIPEAAAVLGLSSDTIRRRIKDPNHPLEGKKVASRRGPTYLVWVDEVHPPAETDENHYAVEDALSKLTSQGEIAGLRSLLRTVLVGQARLTKLITEKMAEDRTTLEKLYELEERIAALERHD